jgi:hypothetical protein
MRYDKKAGKKAAEGDTEAALDIVLMAPTGNMKEGEDAMGFAKRTKDQGGYGSKGPEYEEKLQAIEDILDEHGVDNPRAVAEDLCQAIIDGRIPHVSSDLPEPSDEPEDEEAEEPEEDPEEVSDAF